MLKEHASFPHYSLLALGLNEGLALFGFGSREGRKLDTFCHLYPVTTGTLGNLKVAMESFYLQSKELEPYSLLHRTTI